MSHALRTLAAVVCAGTLAGAAPAPHPASAGGTQERSHLRRLSPDAMMEDLFLLTDTFEREHGGLHRYISAEELDPLLGAALGELEEERSVLEFFRVVCRLISAVRCGHTAARLPDGDLQAILGRNGMLPFEVCVDGERAWVTRVLDSSVELEPGVELLAVEGQTIATIRARAFACLSGDGFVESGKERNLERRFARCFALYADDRPDGQESFRVRTAEREVLVPAIAPEAYDRASAREPDARPNVHFDIRSDDDVGILAIQGFGDRTGEPAFPDSLEQGFGQLRDLGIGHLILDLRGNGGGRDMYGALLVSYMADEPFGYFERIEVSAGYDGGGGVVEKDGMRLVTEHQGLQIQQPAAKRFMGDVFLLTDGWTFSTAADVATVAHHNGLATLVGEETGGGYDGNTSGSSRTLLLPGSGLGVNVPHWMYTTANVGHDFPGRGAVPHHHVRPTVEDVLRGRDAELEFVLERIRRE